MTGSLRTFALAAVADVPPTTDTTTRTLSGLVVPYGQTTSRYGTEIVFEKGCLALPERLSDVKLLVQHDDERPVGYAVDATDTDAGLEMTFELADHPRSDALLEEAAALLRDGFSVGVEVNDDTLNALMDAFWGDREDAGPVVMAGDLREVSAVSIPQFNDARQSHAAPVLATFTTSRGIAVSTSTASAVPTGATVELAAQPPVQPADLPSLAELAAAVSELIGGQSPSHPLAAFSSLDAYADAAFGNPALRFALVDQTTVDNAVLVQPAWLTEIVGIIDAGRPAITALGGGSGLPSSGMELDWPYYDGDLLAIVKQQVAEKTPINSVKVSFKKGSAPIDTYAGGSDVSYQLIRRSSPSYREAYLRILALAYGLTTEATFVAALYAAAGGNVTWDPATGTAPEFRAALFAASGQVKRATGAPATAVLVAPDVFERLGSMDGLVPQSYGTQNVSGTATASTLKVDVSGLDVTEAWALEDGQVVVTNELAAGWFGDGPFIVTAEDVEKLGQNIAVWGMGATRAALPAGIVTLTAVPPVTTRSGSRSKS